MLLSVNRECIVMEPFVYQKLLSVNFIFMQDFFLVSSQSFHRNLYNRQFICTSLHNLPNHSIIRGMDKDESK